MARPKTKAELLRASYNQFVKLLEFVNSFSEEEKQRDFPEGTLNRNIRDVLAHLYHWHVMMLTWYQVGMNGDKPEMPAKGYTWRTVPDLNKFIQKKYSTESLTKVLDDLQQSHKQVLTLITQHSDEELFEKKRYSWTGSTSLGAYLISATSSHYEWAYKLIRKAKKAQSVRS